MKRIFILFAAMALAFSTHAQLNQNSNYIGLNVGGGINSAFYSTDSASWMPRLGCLGELKYAHFFGEHFGLGFGVQYSLVRPGASFDDMRIVETQTHFDNNLRYDLHSRFVGWKEVQTLHFLNVPIQLYWRNALNERWSFLLGLGASIDLFLGGKYEATDGSYVSKGKFPSSEVWYYNMPEYGFGQFDSENAETGDVELKKLGVSLIGDLGFNYALSGRWGLYMGLYASYGLTNLIEAENEINNRPITYARNAVDGFSGYNGLVNSDLNTALHLFTVGLKLGLNFGWNCDHTAKVKNEPVMPVIVPAAEPAANDESAKESRCQSNSDMALALADIDADIAAAEKVANENGDARAKAAVAKAKKNAADAKEAHKNGMYCHAFDLLRDAYASVADSYAADAANCVSTKQNDKAAADAADAAKLYATAAHNGDVAAAMAANRNAKINASIACQPVEKKSPYEDLNYSERLSREALAMGSIADSKAAQDDARSAAEKGKAGHFAESFATSAASFAKSADAFAAKCSKPEAKRLAQEANNHAAASAEAAKQGNVETAYTEAVAARDAANRIPAICAKAEPMKQVEVQEKLDAINATVNFAFANDKDAEFDEKTNDALNTIVKNLQADKNLNVLITGHTDNIGSEATNIRYGKKRAETLKALLVKRGAPAAQISTDSKGPKEPVASNDTEEGRYQNRRAVITIK